MLGKVVKDISWFLEKTSTGALYLLKAPTSAFTLKNLLGHIINGCLSNNEIELIDSE